MSDLRLSYTSANTFPVKLLLNEGARSLRPVHIQWLPTNHCNMHCPFCSCADRDRRLEMHLDTALEVIREFAGLGTRAVTITGGGEPLCHPGLPRMIQEFRSWGIRVGLVTNGLLLGKVDREILAKLTWCRISNSDYRELTEEYRAILDSVTEVPIDWAFSHVVSSKPNLPEIKRIVEYASEKNFTHVRLVGDLLEPAEIPFDSIREALAGIDRKVIYQPRKDHELGSNCLIGYVKPVIYPDFRMYLCCGAQYAFDGMTRDMPAGLCMGNAWDLQSVYSGEQRAFDVHCDRCYYREYNELLNLITRTVGHKEFL